MPRLAPALSPVSLDSLVDTPEGIAFTFATAMVLLIAVMGSVPIIAISLIERSFVPWLFYPLFLPLFLKNKWVFCYRGPSVSHRLSLFGLTVWKRTWPLKETDSASVEPADMLILQDRWYQLMLWSNTLQRDRRVLKSNDPVDMERLAAMLNDAIKTVCAKAASLE
jgi:hypothetical protein